MQKARQVGATGSANVFGVEVAIVTNVKDPDQQGRVKICFPRLRGLPESSWARIAQPAAGAGRGFYWIPEVNDEVLVAFEMGQTNRPYVIGCLWNGKDKPMKDAYTDDNTTRMIQTKSGHQICLSDKSGDEKIVISDKTGKRVLTFDCKAKKLLIEGKEGSVEIKAKKKIVLQCEDLEIKTSKTGKLDIGSTFDLNVSSDGGMKSGSTFTLKGSQVQLNPSASWSATLAAAAAAAARAVAAAAGAAAGGAAGGASGAAAGGAAGGGAAARGGAGAGGAAAGTGTAAAPQPGTLSNPRWSSASYLHGESADMQVDAPSLDGSTVRFVVERHVGANWEPWTELTATVTGGSAKASVQIEAEQLQTPTWLQEPDKGPTLVVEAQGVPDGREVKFIVEKEDSGQWQQAAEATAKVQSGKVQAPITLPDKGSYRFHAELLPEAGKGNLRFRAELV